MSPALPVILRGGGVLRDPLKLSDLAFWYDPFDLSSMVIDGSNRVSLWADKSPWSRVNGLVLNGATGNYAGTPDSAALSITGDIDIRAEVQMPDWTPSAVMAFVAKDDNGVSGGGNRSYLFYITTDGKLNLFWYSSSGLNSASSVATGFADFSRRWIRATLDVDNGAGGNDTKFWTSEDGVTWTQLGATVTKAGTTFIQDAGYAVNVGANQNGAVTGNILNGIIYRAQIYSGINGTIAFDADFTLAAKLATSFTESSLNAATVTINTSGATGARISGARDLYQGTVANQPVYSVVDGVPRLTLDGSNDFVKSASFPFVQPETVQGVFSQITNTNTDGIFDGFAENGGLLQQTGTTGINVFAGSGFGSTNLSLSTQAVISVAINGASSGLRLNRAAAVTGSSGSNTMGGYTLGARGNSSGFSNITAGEIIGRSSLAATSTYEQDRVIRYLARRGRIAA